MTKLRHSDRVSTARTIPWLAFLLLLFTLPLAGGERTTRFVTEPGTGKAPTQRFVTITADFEQVEFPSGDIHHPVSLTNLAFSAVCTIGTNEWRIDLRFGRQTQQLCFDGTNVYYNDNFPSGNSRVTVSSRPSYIGCPLGATMHNMPWLAFCSGNYLKREGRLIPLPVPTMIFGTLASPDNLAYSDRTPTFQDDLGLPQTVDMFASDSLFSASVTNGVFQGNHDVELWKRGSTGFKWDFPEGALRFHYAVTRSTNFLGWNIPVAFEWFRNDFEHGALIPRMGGRGSVTSIIAATKPASVIVPGATIWDYRFRDAGLLSLYDRAIEYTTTHTFVPPTNDPVLQEKLAERLARKRGP